MIQKKKIRSEAMNILGNRISMTKPEFVEEKRRLLRDRGIDTGLLLLKFPKSQVIEQLIEELPKIGVNKWVADQAAKEIYDRVEKELIMEGKIAAKPESKETKARESNNRLLSLANQKRRDGQNFTMWKNRLEPRVIMEVQNSLYRLNMREEEFIQLVKLSGSFNVWAKEHSVSESENMAIEIARSIKRREMWKRKLHERVRTP